MQLQRDQNHGNYILKSYEQGKLTINDDTHTQSVIVTKTHLITNWRPESINDLIAADFTEILALKPQILIIGTGETQQFPDQAVLAPLIDQQIGIEIMDTHAACRTFNILMAEDRHAIAALIV